MTFLEVVTRCYKRPQMLATNQASLEAQTCDDWRQTLIMDDVGRGMGWAQEQLAKVDVSGRYIWILDDDDECIRPALVEELRVIAAEHNPGVIMLRMDHGKMGVKPDNGYWGKPPEGGHIGVSAYVTRRDVWQQHAGAFLSAHYASDFDFISAVFASRPAVYWHDVVASRVQRISHGAPE
jgi:hypothetical protein